MILTVSLDQRKFKLLTILFPVLFKIDILLKESVSNS